MQFNHNNHFSLGKSEDIFLSQALTFLFFFFPNLANFLLLYKWIEFLKIIFISMVKKDNILG